MGRPSPSVLGSRFLWAGQAGCVGYVERPHPHAFGESLSRLPVTYRPQVLVWKFPFPGAQRSMESRTLGCRNNSSCPYWALTGLSSVLSAFHALSCILGKFKHHYYPHFTGSQTEALRVLQHLPAFSANEGQDGDPAWVPSGPSRRLRVWSSRAGLG